MSLWVWLYYGFWYLMPLRRFDEALAAMRKALELDPLSPWTKFNSSYYYYLTRQWDRAIEQCHETLELDPKYYLAYQFLGFTYFQKGDLEEGIRACEMAAQVVGQSPWAVAFRAIACAKAGRIDEVKGCLDELLKLSQKSYVSPIIFSWIYCSLGEIDQAVEWTEKSMEEHTLIILHLHIFPLFDPIRCHPRYKTLLRKMNLEP